MLQRIQAVLQREQRRLQNAAKLRLQVWLVQHSGWVAVDDLTVDDLTVAGWDGSTKHSVFNGQRVAMRQGSKLYYLHTDHLGSTKLVTDQVGNAVQAGCGYSHNPPILLIRTLLSRTPAHLMQRQQPNPGH